MHNERSHSQLFAKTGWGHHSNCSRSEGTFAALTVQNNIYCSHRDEEDLHLSTQELFFHHLCVQSLLKSLYTWGWNSITGQFIALHLRGQRNYTRSQKSVWQTSLFSLLIDNLDVGFLLEQPEVSFVYKDVWPLVSGVPVYLCNG